MEFLCYKGLESHLGDFIFFMAVLWAYVYMQAYPKILRIRITTCNFWGAQCSSKQFSLVIKFPNVRAERNPQNDLIVLFKICHQTIPKEKENGPFVFLISIGKSQGNFYLTTESFLIYKNTFPQMLNLISQ